MLILERGEDMSVGGLSAVGCGEGGREEDPLELPGVTAGEGVRDGLCECCCTTIVPGDIETVASLGVANVDGLGCLVVNDGDFVCSTAFCDGFFDNTGDMSEDEGDGGSGVGAAECVVNGVTVITGALDDFSGSLPDGTAVFDATGLDMPELVDVTWGDGEGHPNSTGEGVIVADPAADLDDTGVGVVVGHVDGPLLDTRGVGVALGEGTIVSHVDVPPGVGCLGDGSILTPEVGAGFFVCCE